jgi:hypothetical protein
VAAFTVSEGRNRLQNLPLTFRSVVGKLALVLDVRSLAPRQQRLDLSLRIVRDLNLNSLAAEVRAAIEARTESSVVEPVAATIEVKESVIREPTGQPESDPAGLADGLAGPPVGAVYFNPSSVPRFSRDPNIERCWRDADAAEPGIGPHRPYTAHVARSLDATDT